LYGGDRENPHPAGNHFSASAACARSARSAFTPTVWHLNEGHAAFVASRDSRNSSSRRSFDDALEEVKRSTVFTTHTPVPAGHDAFPFSAGREHLAARGARSASIAGAFSRSAKYDNGSGSQIQHDGARAAHCVVVNGVSALHGE
jgi:glucan phosphorylase